VRAAEELLALVFRETEGQPDAPAFWQAVRARRGKAEIGSARAALVHCEPRC
jgi:hypothetical protein